MLARAGHWLADLIYIAPVLAVVGFVVVQNLRDRRDPQRRARREAEDRREPTVDEIRYGTP